MVDLEPSRLHLAAAAFTPWHAIGLTGTLQDRKPDGTWKLDTHQAATLSSSSFRRRSGLIQSM